MAATFIRLCARVATLEPASLLKYLVLGRFLGLSIYFSFDNLAWAIKTQIFKGNSAWFVKQALRWYLLSIACTVILDTIQWQMNSKEVTRLREFKSQIQQKHSKRKLLESSVKGIAPNQSFSLSDEELEDIKRFGENDVATALTSHREYLAGSKRSLLSFTSDVDKELDFFL